MPDTRLKILWLAHESNLSGANIAMLEYIDALRYQFSFFIILPHEGNMQKELDQRNVSYKIVYQYGWINIHPWWHIYKWIKVLLRSILAVLQTIKLISSEKPNIVSTNTLVPFTASIAAFFKKVPHVWWIHEYGKEDFGFSIGWGFESISLKWINYSSKLIIANSNSILSKFSKLLSNANITSIYQPVTWRVNGADLKIKKSRFLMFGQLVESKGHRDVLKAMLDNRDKGKHLYSLDIKGPCVVDSYLAELQYFIKQNELDKFVNIDAGYFEKEQIIPQYEVVIVASKSEAFGRVIVEANKAGLYVLVRDSGGAPELINETNGHLFSNQNELALALSGDLKFPTSEIKINYTEDAEIKKLIKLLYKVSI